MNTSRLDNTLAALADPTRRSVVDLLRTRPRRPSAMAVALGLSAPAISRHLRVLRTQGLIAEDRLERDARVRLYRLRQEPFDELQRWLEQVQSFWTEQLDAFKAHVEHGPSGDRT